MKHTHLRIARPVSQIQRSMVQYMEGLGLQLLGSFSNHEGFDGVMLGVAGAGYHLEFTCCRDHALAPTPTPEDLLVLYEPELEQWEARCRAMVNAGFKEVEPFNPYWKQAGRTYEDGDGYRVVIQCAQWRDGAS